MFSSPQIWFKVGRRSGFYLDMIQIKKYENRRLYSSSEKRYVTLAEISAWVIAGKKVQVIDVTTKKDITAEILTQILLENGRAQHLPVEMLEAIIRFNENVIKSLWSPLMGSSLEAMVKWNPFFNWAQASKTKPPSKS